MKLPKLAFILVFSQLCLFWPIGFAGNYPVAVQQSTYPNRSIVIKNPAADDTKTFFSENTVYSFEVYKPGDMNAVIAAIKADKSVENCVQGKITGDFTALILTLKSKKDKSWFIALFKKAGLNHIKVNRNEMQLVDKL